MTPVKLTQRIVVRVYHARACSIADFVSAPACAPRPIDILGVLQILLERHPLPHRPADRRHRHRKAMPPQNLPRTVAVRVLRVFGHQRAAPRPRHLPSEHRRHLLVGEARQQCVQHGIVLRRAVRVQKNHELAIGRRHGPVQNAPGHVRSGRHVLYAIRVLANLLQRAVGRRVIEGHQDERVPLRL